MKVVDTREYVGMLKELTEEGKEVSMLVFGSSMAPFLIHARDMIYFKKPDRELQKGDIVFFRRKSGQFVMHRIWKIRPEGYYIVGDAQTQIEGPVKREQIFALITKVRRKEKWLEPGDFWWEFFEHVWIRIKEDLLGKKTGRVIYRDNLTVFQTSGGECRFINFLGMDWHYAVSSQEGVNQYHVWCVPEVAEMLDQDTVYLAAFSLEKQAIKDHSMILHSAYMCYEDTAVLFSAPSETGKSTQAGLWEKYRGTWTVNGDRSLLIREEDGWYANGWPVCGSSEICNNKSYPVRAIVMLSQAKENRISRLKGLEALRKVMEQITINAWNSEFQIQAMDELEILLKEVPVYHLECDISEDAVRCLEDVLAGGRGEE